MYDNSINPQLQCYSTSYRKPLEEYVIEADPYWEGPIDVIESKPYEGRTDECYSPFLGVL